MQAATGDLASSAALPVQGEQASAGDSLFQFTGDWFSHNTATWQRVLASKNWLENSNQDVHILEVGSWEGRSAVWFLQHVCLNINSSLTAVDCWLGGQLYGERAKSFGLDEHIHSAGRVEGRFDHNVAATGAQDKVVKLKGRSLQVLARLVADAANFYDVVYIDGSHAARDVIADAVLAWALLRPGGILIFDDYRYEHILDLPAEEYPKTAIDAFVTLFAKELFVLEVGYQYIVEKCVGQ